MFRKLFGIKHRYLIGCLHVKDGDFLGAFSIYLTYYKKMHTFRDLEDMHNDVFLEITKKYPNMKKENIIVLSINKL